MSFPTMSLVNLQPTAGSQSRPLVLNEGQLFHGQIKQLFPGQMAEVQIGGQKLYAKLEVPMKAGDSYFFQVSSVKPELQLKIISGPVSGAEGPARQLANLMESMQLPRTTEMQEILSFVLKNKIPMTREGLLAAEALLKSVPATARDEALATIQKMVELKLPFNETVFRALFGVQSKEGLHTVLSAFRGVLTTDLTVSPQLKEAILSALDKAGRPFLQATGGALLGQSLVTILNSNESPDVRFTTLQILKSADLLPERTSLANLQQVLTSLLSEGAGTRSVTTESILSQQPSISSLLKQITTSPQAPLNAPLSQLKSLISAETSLSPANKDLLTSLITHALNSQPTAETATKFSREFSLALIRITAETAITSPFQSASQGVGAKEQLLSMLGQPALPEILDKLSTLVRNAEQSNHPAVQKQVQLAETAVATAVDGKAVKEAIQMVVRSFGLNYEAGLLSKDADIGRLSGTLKPQLLALMQNFSVAQSVRESAEMVVTRMNGPLLASSEIGVQHQLVMQVPLEFFGKRIDTTLQWNGRMKEDGKIDSSFARILFYLDLHSLDKTIIDMQVQNKIVTLTVYNSDQDLKLLGSPMQEALRSGLESVGYKLSGVFFKAFNEDEKTVEPTQKQMTSSDQGVDFRI